MSDTNPNLDHIRHTLAHLLAAAVLRHYPKAKRTIGPAIENGFYQDFDLGKHAISEADLKKIEEKMRELLPLWHEFVKDEAILLKDREIEILNT